MIDLHNKDVNAPGAAWSTAESSTERKRFRLEYAWDLGKMENANLKPGDELEFFVQVKDNFSLPGVCAHPFVASSKLQDHHHQPRPVGDQRRERPGADEAGDRRDQEATRT